MTTYLQMTETEERIFESITSDINNWLESKPSLIPDHYPVLHTKCVDIPRFFVEIQKDLIKKVVDVLTAYVRFFRAAGIAAPQLGLPYSIALVPTDDLITNFIAAINPVITDRSVKRSFEKEGCLSYTDCLVGVWRNQEVTVSFLDVNGHSRSAVISGFAGRVWQHEIDHLNGIVMVDHGKIERRKKPRSKLINDNLPNPLLVNNLPNQQQLDSYSQDME